MADIVLINPKFEISFWGLEHALPFVGKRANMPVAALPLLGSPPPRTPSPSSTRTSSRSISSAARAPTSSASPA
jgi:hypothetical protein